MSAKSNIDFPAKIRDALLKMCETEAGKHDKLDPYATNAVRQRKVDGKLFVPDLSTFYGDKDTSGRYNLIFSYYHNLKERHWVAHVRDALEEAHLNIKGERKTKSGQYSSYWFIVEGVALEIATLRRGGKGVLCHSVEYANEQYKESDKQLNEEAKRERLIESAKRKLSDDELWALGLRR